MLQYRKYIIEFRNKEYDGKIAQQIGTITFFDIKYIQLLSKIGVTIKLKQS